MLEFYTAKLVIFKASQLAMAPSTSQPTDDVSVDRFTLYMFPFSLYSIMSRFTYVLGKTFLDNYSPDSFHLDLKLVNLHRDGNISEEYLTKVNSKGQVQTNHLIPSPSFLKTQKYRLTYQGPRHDG